jgi:curved DNA-binding protein CbpA
LQRTKTNHYATLGLDRCCAPAQIRAAYRVQAKQQHPDLNPCSSAAVARTQGLNEAYKILSNPALRATHDRELDAPKKSAGKTRVAKNQNNLTRDVDLRLDDFLRGTKREVRVNDPANPYGVEIYELIIPPETAPGTRFRFALRFENQIRIRRTRRSGNDSRTCRREIARADSARRFARRNCARCRRRPA